MSTTRTVIVAAVIAACSAFAMVTPPPAAAECSVYARWPSFRSVVATADTVVIGRVTKDLGTDEFGYAAWFDLTVDEVLRGSSAAHRAFARGIVPLLDACESYVRTRVGDQLAVAYRGSDNGHPDVPFVAAVAFLNRDPETEPPGLMPGVRRMSIAEVRAIVDGLPPTDAAEPMAAAAQTRAQPLLAVAVLGAAAWLLLRRRPHSKWRRPGSA